MIFELYLWAFKKKQKKQLLVPWWLTVHLFPPPENQTTQAFWAPLKKEGEAGSHHSPRHQDQQHQARELNDAHPFWRNFRRRKSVGRSFFWPWILGVQGGQTWWGCLVAEQHWDFGLGNHSNLPNPLFSLENWRSCRFWKSMLGKMYFLLKYVLIKLLCFPLRPDFLLGACPFNSKPPTLRLFPRTAKQKWWAPRRGPSLQRKPLHLVGGSVNQLSKIKKQITSKRILLRLSNER